MIPVILIILYVGFVLLLRSIFPSGKELVDFLETLYGRFGYEIISIGSFFEALAFINFFVPGVLAVGFGVIFAKVGDLDLTFVILAATSGAILGYMLDFVLGRFGFGQLLEKMGYKKMVDVAKLKIEKFDWKTFSLGFIHPNIGAMVALAAGALKIDFRKFFVLASLSTLVWYILWGLLIFALGKIFLTIFSRYVFILFMLVGAIWILGIVYGRNKRR
ncbi:MAG: VTT domain-containing protein [Patescibacteria group bacterium]